MEEQKVSRAEAVKLLWRRGVLSWKLDDNQKELYELYHKSDHKIQTWLLSRRIGKSYTLCTLALEICNKNPHTIVKYVAPTKTMVRTIIRPLIRQLIEDCPAELRPEYKTQEYLYRFPNGSEIQLAGTDAGHAEGLRGGSAHLCIVDEAGFCNELEYTVKSILLPTLTTTKGKLILSSTPPVNFDHDFRGYVEECQLSGAFIKKTVYDNPRFAKDDIEGIIKDCGGVESTEFRREYLCEFIVDDTMAVVPEFTAALRKEIVIPWERPVFYDAYVGGDLGFKDLTVMLFAYYDFKAGKLIIEDELVMNGPKMTTESLAEAIKAKETKNFTNSMTGEQLPMYKRVCDNNLIVINDLDKLHNLYFFPTAKDDSDAAINNMRIMLTQRRIIINPRCVTLVRHLENAIWNKNRKDFARSKDNGHYDGVAALKYLVRNIDFHRNPYPNNSFYGDGRMKNPFFKEERSKFEESLVKIYKVKSSLKKSN